MQASEVSHESDEAVRSWLEQEFQLDAPACAALLRYFSCPGSASEIPRLSALSIETVTMQGCTEYFVHTPLSQSGNETIARVLLQRWHAARCGAPWPCLLTSVSMC